MKRAAALLPILLALCAAALFAGPAQAAPAASAWQVQSLPAPTNFAAADNAECAALLGRGNPPCDAFTVQVTNVGAKAADGSPITLADTLPAGVTVRRISFFWSKEEFDLNRGETLCTTTPALQCTLPGAAVGPDETLQMVTYVTVDEPSTAGPLTNLVSVDGGGAAPASASSTNQISGATPPFGISAFGDTAWNPAGAADTRAGGHPYSFTTTIDPNTIFSSKLLEGKELPTSVRDIREVIVDLPPGFFGSALAAPECSLVALASRLCPAASVVGHLTTEPTGGVSIDSPIWNLVPEQGEPAEFGYLDLDANTHVLYPSIAPTASGYVLRVRSPELPQVDLRHISVVFYGDPAARDGGREEEAGDVPFFTNAAACDGRPLVTSVHIDSWAAPGAQLADGSPDFGDPNWASASSESPPVGGCGNLRFEPTIAATVENPKADSPSGFDVDLTVPQNAGTASLATPPLKRAVITLPEGLVVNPSSANGLAACSLAEIGISAGGQPDAAAPSCPEASKLGTLELESPALPGILHGEIYLARQGENPFGSLLAIYLVVDDARTGVLVKIPAEVEADPQTGRLQTVVDQSPQFPFSELRTHFFAGDTAALRTPATCGSYGLGSELTPWSAPESGPPATPSAPLTVSAAAGAGPCPTSAASEPNAPAFEAGTENPSAGAYSPFVLKLSREDGSQELGGIDTTLPEGLLGRLAGIPYCSDASLAAAAQKSGAAEQASASCPAGSQVGVVNVGAGAGPRPYYVQGKAYLAGPYKGAPLSLAIVTPAVAGPFDLGTVVVRTALNVDPLTAQIHAVSDPFPRILQGIPLDIRSINLRLDRPNFTLNPTSCDSKQIEASVTSTLGNVAPLSERFQVGACKALAFKPKLQLSLKGSTKRTGNPALRAVVTYPKGFYANIAKAQVTLPHSAFLEQSHIRTVCTRVQFAAKACPAGSIYGSARAVSPLLDQPLEGPVYLRSSSHKLPDLVVDLKGQIEVVLDGKVDTGKEDGLRTTFQSVPDAPVSKFTLNLDGGKKGLIVNSENLCSPKAKVRAVSDLVAQNGKIYDTTPTVMNSCGGRDKKSKGSRKSAKG